MMDSYITTTTTTTTTTNSDSTSSSHGKFISQGKSSTTNMFRKNLMFKFVYNNIYGKCDNKLFANKKKDRLRGLHMFCSERESGVHSKWKENAYVQVVGNYFDKNAERIPNSKPNLPIPGISKLNDYLWICNKTCFIKPPDPIQVDTSDSTWVYSSWVCLEKHRFGKREKAVFISNSGVNIHAYIDFCGEEGQAQFCVMQLNNSIVAYMEDESSCFDIWKGSASDYKNSNTNSNDNDKYRWCHIGVFSASNDGTYFFVNGKFAGKAGLELNHAIYTIGNAANSDVSAVGRINDIRIYMFKTISNNKNWKEEYARRLYDDYLSQDNDHISDEIVDNKKSEMHIEPPFNHDDVSNSNMEEEVVGDKGNNKNKKRKHDDNDNNDDNSNINDVKIRRVEPATSEVEATGSHSNANNHLPGGESININIVNNSEKDDNGNSAQEARKRWMVENQQPSEFEATETSKQNEGISDSNNSNDDDDDDNMSDIESSNSDSDNSDNEEDFNAMEASKKQNMWIKAQADSKSTSGESSSINTTKKTVVNENEDGDGNSERSSTISLLDTSDSSNNTIDFEARGNFDDVVQRVDKMQEERQQQQQQQQQNTISAEKIIHDSSDENNTSSDEDVDEVEEEGDEETGLKYLYSVTNFVETYNNIVASLKQVIAKHSSENKTPNNAHDVKPWKPFFEELIANVGKGSFIKTIKDISMINYYSSAVIYGLVPETWSIETMLNEINRNILDQTFADLEKSGKLRFILQFVKCCFEWFMNEFQHLETLTKSSNKLVLDKWIEYCKENPHYKWFYDIVKIENVIKNENGTPLLFQGLKMWVKGPNGEWETDVCCICMGNDQGAMTTCDSCFDSYHIKCLEHENVAAVFSIPGVEGVDYDVATRDDESQEVEVISSGRHSATSPALNNEDDDMGCTASSKCKMCKFNESLHYDVLTNNLKQIRYKIGSGIVSPFWQNVTKRYHKNSTDRPKRLYNAVHLAAQENGLHALQLMLSPFRSLVENKGTEQYINRNDIVTNNAASSGVPSRNNNNSWLDVCDNNVSVLMPFLKMYHEETHEDAFNISVDNRSFNVACQLHLWGVGNTETLFALQKTMAKKSNCNDLSLGIEPNVPVYVEKVYRGNHDNNNSTTTTTTTTTTNDNNNNNTGSSSSSSNSKNNNDAKNNSPSIALNFQQKNNFLYITESLEHPNVIPDWFSKEMKGCTSEETYCCSAKYQRETVEIRQKCMQCHASSHQIKLNCHELCRCYKPVKIIEKPLLARQQSFKSECCRRSMARYGTNVFLEVFHTNTPQGYAVRTRQFIPKGQFVCSYIGEIINDIEEGKRENRHYILQLDDGSKQRTASLVDGRRYRSVSSFINHQCKKGGNLDRIPFHEYHSDKEYPHVGFFANCDIDVGQELTFNYKKGTKGKPFERCYCDTCAHKYVNKTT